MRVLIVYNGGIMQEEFSEIMNKLSENARFALQKSDYYAKRYNKYSIIEETSNGAIQVWMHS